MGTTVVGLASQAFGSINIGGIRYRISLPCGSTVFYENRAQWIGKYEKIRENIVMRQQMFHD